MEELSNDSMFRTEERVKCSVFNRGHLLINSVQENTWSSSVSLSLVQLSVCNALGRAANFDEEQGLSKMSNSLILEFLMASKTSSVPTCLKVKLVRLEQAVIRRTRS